MQSRYLIEDFKTTKLVFTTMLNPVQLGIHGLGMDWKRRKAHRKFIFSHLAKRRALSALSGNFILPGPTRLLDGAKLKSVLTSGMNARLRRLFFGGLLSDWLLDSSQNCISRLLTLCVVPYPEGKVNIEINICLCRSKLLE